MEIAYDLLSDDHDMIVAVGGDGTVHEVASGLRGSKKKMGILPIGSGNVGVPMPMDNLEALVLVHRGQLALKQWT